MFCRSRCASVDFDFKLFIPKFQRSANIIQISDHTLISIIIMVGDVGVTRTIFLLYPGKPGKNRFAQFRFSTLLEKVDLVNIFAREAYFDLFMDWTCRSFIWFS